MCIAFLSSIAQQYNKSNPATTVEGKERRNEREREREKKTKKKQIPRGSATRFVSVSRSPNHVFKFATLQNPAISRQVPNHILKYVTSQNPAISRQVPNHILKSVKSQNPTVSRQVSNHILKSIKSQNPAISHALKSKPGDDISTNVLFTRGNCATLLFLPHTGLVILY
jgi:hypothetical protein